MNTFICVGVINKDPDYRMTEKGDAMLRLSVRVPSTRKGQDGKYVTNYFDFTAWGKTATFIKEYFQKGSQISINSIVQNFKYEKQGVPIYGNNFIISSVNFVPEARINDSNEYSNNSFN